MSIKQGEYLKKLRAESNLSQEQLAERLGLSRQSVSKWEQGISTPDTDNFVKLSEIYNIPVDSLIKGEPVQIGNAAENNTTADEGNCIYEPSVKKKKRGWFFISYPVIAVIIYTVLGSFFGVPGWAYGWIVLLTIPMFYTGVIAFEKKNPVIFCYPAVALTVFLLAGFFMKAWHPAWIVFLTIPIYYVISVKTKK